MSFNTQGQKRELLRVNTHDDKGNLHNNKTSNKLLVDVHFPTEHGLTFCRADNETDLSCLKNTSPHNNDQGIGARTKSQQLQLDMKVWPLSSTNKAVGVDGGDRRRDLMLV